MSACCIGTMTFGADPDVDFIYFATLRPLHTAVKLALDTGKQILLQ